MASDNSRKKIINKMLLMAIICIILGSVFLIYFIKETRTSIVTFKESNNNDYKVYLKENEFYENNYVEKDNQYIANLIDNIMINFDYKMNISNRYTYNYAYKVVADVEVKDVTNDNMIYEFKENLYESEEINNTGLLDIKKDIKIDYPKYNDLINKFKTTYELDTAKATLNINLYLNMDKLNNNKDVISDKIVSSLSIPLAENTIAIDKVNAEENYSLSLNGRKDIYWMIGVSIIFLLVGIIYLVLVIIYAMRTRTAEMIYQKEIKSIVSNYDSYIQRITGSYDIGTSQVIKIETFNDMLEIRDTLKQPILMLENDNKTGTFFIIPATNSIIYTYALRVVDIEAKMEGKEIPTYDITEIHQSEIKKKKYTEDYIKDEITRTSLMPVVDQNNIIKGNKDREKDLYEQLELTTSFSLDEIKKAVRKAKKRKDNKLREKEEKQRQLKKLQNKKTKKR